MNRVYQGPQSRTVCQSLTAPLLQGFLPKKEREREDALQGQAVLDKLLSFLIKGVTCLAKRPNTWDDSKFVGWLGDGFLSMVLNSSFAEEIFPTHGL